MKQLSNYLPIALMISLLLTACGAPSENDIKEALLTEEINQISVDGQSLVFNIDDISIDSKSEKGGFSDLYVSVSMSNEEVKTTSEYHLMFTKTLKDGWTLTKCDNVSNEEILPIDGPVNFEADLCTWINENDINGILTFKEKKLSIDDGFCEFVYDYSSPDSNDSASTCRQTYEFDYSYGEWKLVKTVIEF